MTKPIIAVDIDDVLADYALGFIEFSNRHWSTSLTIDDYDEHWAEVWKVDTEEVRRRADMIHGHRMVKSLAHKPEARPILEKLSHTYDIIVVTSRRIQNREDTLVWLEMYYPMLRPEAVTFSGFFDTIDDSSILKTKGSIVASLGASFVIDDQPKHCISATEHGLKALLFGNYLWNQVDALPEGVTRVNDWAGVERYFDGI